MKRLKDNVLMSSASKKSLRIFSAIAGVLFFGAIYLTVFSAVSESGAYILGILTGMALASAYLAFKGNKFTFWIALCAALIYTALCAALGFTHFYHGVLNFLNNVSAASNSHMHWGLNYFEAQKTGLGDFLFVSSVSVWLAFAVCVFSANKRILIALAVVITLFLLFMGLFPALYAVILLLLAVLAVLAADKGYTLKNAACYLLGAAVIIGALAPCCIYSGSSAIRSFRESVVYSAESVFYGKDSLPEGNLKKAQSIRSSSTVRLEVELTPQVRTLYLKGYVGSQLEGSKFTNSDKNTYVENGYQGLISKLQKKGMPATQVSVYSAFNGHRDSETVRVKNKNANLKYIYAPYSASSFSAGSIHYDLNLRGNLFSSKSYEFTMFAGDRSSERVKQADWLSDPSLRTRAMNDYLALEQEYRAFVYDEYLKLDERQWDIISSALGRAQTNSVNGATQEIRSYFNENFTCSDDADEVDGDFLKEFYCGNIKSATSVYFAAAATYAFRFYGIPARYVEGYLVNPLDDSVNAVTVTGKSSHAWTEVYFDGIGWLPIEVTPEFFDSSAPDNPDAPPPVDPEAPDVPDNPDEPVKPDNPTPAEPKPYENDGLYKALKILVPILAVLCGLVALAAIAEGRRLIILSQKNKKLKAEGEQFGRAAYSIMARDLKRLGGFSFETLQKYGISKTSYERFMELVEKSVYGGYDLTANERNFISYFIMNVQSVVTRKGSFVHKLYCKYIACIGI